MTTATLNLRKPAPKLEVRPPSKMGAARVMIVRCKDGSEPDRVCMLAYTEYDRPTVVWFNTHGFTWSRVSYLDEKFEFVRYMGADESITITGE